MSWLIPPFIANAHKCFEPGETVDGFRQALKWCEERFDITKDERRAWYRFLRERIEEDFTVLDDIAEAVEDAA